MDATGNDSVPADAAQATKEYDYDVFISYHRDTGFKLACAIRCWFQSKGIRAFLDVSELELGEWKKSLDDAIAHSRYFFLLLTKDGFSENVEAEAKCALNCLDKAKIVPVLTAPDVKLPALLKDCQASQLNTSPAAFLDSLSVLVQKYMNEFRQRVIEKEKGVDQLLLAMRWYQRNDGKIDEKEDALLREQARKLKINDEKFNELKKLVTGEWVQECKFKDESIRKFFMEGNGLVDPEDYEKLLGEARKKIGIGQDRLNELILIVQAEEMGRRAVAEAEEKGSQAVAQAEEKGRRATEGQCLKLRKLCWFLFLPLCMVLLASAIGAAYAAASVRRADETAGNRWEAEREELLAEMDRVRVSAEQIKIEAEKRAEVASSVLENSEKSAKASKDRMQRELDAANAASAAATTARQKAEKELAEANAAFETERAAYLREKEDLKKRDAADLKKMEERAAAAEASSAANAAELSKERERTRQLQEEKADLQKKLDEARLEGLRNI